MARALKDFRLTTDRIIDLLKDGSELTFDQIVGDSRPYHQANNSAWRNEVAENLRMLVKEGRVQGQQDRYDSTVRRYSMPLKDAA